MNDQTSQCAICANRTAQEGDRPTCTAFSLGIPDVIYENRVDHRDPYPGDNAVQFVPLEGLSPEAIAMVFDGIGEGPTHEDILEDVQFDPVDAAIREVLFGEG